MQHQHSDDQLVTEPDMEFEEIFFSVFIKPCKGKSVIRKTKTIYKIRLWSLMQFRTETPTYYNLQNSFMPKA